MDKLVNKAKKTNSKTWKWILGVTISVMLVFALWWLKRRYDELQRLRAEKELTEERQKDMALQAENEKNANLAKALKEEADRLNTCVKERETELIAHEREYEEAKKRVNNAQDWKQLENEARGQ